METAGMNTRAEWKQYDSFAPSRLRLSRVLYACRVEYGVRPCGAGRRGSLCRRRKKQLTRSALLRGALQYCRPKPKKILSTLR
jgi:hypothetical protein